MLTGVCGYVKIYFYCVWKCGYCGYICMDMGGLQICKGHGYGLADIGACY